MIETKEKATLPWPDSDVPSSDGQTASDTGVVEWQTAPGVTPHDTQDALETARAALADEWRAASPNTPADIASFYEHAQSIGRDLELWHALPERQAWTAMLVSVAQQGGAQTIIDIGCGAGHDLCALREALPDAALAGVEPNATLRTEVLACAACVPTVEDALIETADLLVCIDVLEHVPDPEAFLASVAERAPVGCLLFETTATADTGTPLHLPANRGWHPGRCLESHGWAMVDKAGRVRVWRREALAGQQRAGLLLCAYRSVNADTLSCLHSLVGDPGPHGWRVKVKVGDALISRSRNIIVTSWWRETADDVLLMIDDDISFGRGDADRLVQLCRDGHDIICGAYPTHDGAHMACRFLPQTQEIGFGPGHEPLEIAMAATGCMAVHRRVLDRLARDLPLCHANEEWSFYPFFEARTAPNDAAGGQEWLSEDYTFSARARAAGYTVWLDPQTILTHHGMASVSIRNMAALHAALQQV
jgi:predicted TPR repeat methyltransferase